MILFKFIKNFIKMILIYMPGEMGFSLRRNFYKKKLKSLGKNFIIETGVTLDGCEFIEIGDNVRIDRDCIIQTQVTDINSNNYSLENSKFNGERGMIYIEAEVRINARSSIYGYGGVRLGKLSVLSESSKIFSSTHIPNDLNIPSKKTYVKHSNNYIDSPSLDAPIVIEENSFIGVNCQFFPGSSIGKDSFVSPNSVVKNSFDDNCFIEGNPASKIKNRFN